MTNGGFAVDPCTYSVPTMDSIVSRAQTLRLEGLRGVSYNGRRIIFLVLFNALTGRVKSKQIDKGKR